MKYLASLFIVISSFQSIYAQQQIDPSPILWYTLEEAMELNKQQPRPILVDVYTDWCGWCKQLMKTTFANQYIANYINTQYYPVRFDAEGYDTITYLGKTYVNKAKTHDLAIELLNGQLSYPSMIFIMKDSTHSVIPGYMDVPQFEPVMYFFSEEIFRNSSFEAFNKNFTLTYKPAEVAGNSDSLTSGQVHWYTFEEAWEQHQKEPRKWYVDWYADMYVNCNVMSKTSYTNPAIAEYLNTYYYPIRMAANTQDTIAFMGQKYANAGKGPYALHQLAAQFIGAEVSLPTIWWLDENLQGINRMNGYLAPENLEPILLYFGQDKYKNTPWTNYRQQFTGKVQ